MDTFKLININDLSCYIMHKPSSKRNYTCVCIKPLPVVVATGGEEGGDGGEGGEGGEGGGGKLD